MSEIKIKASKVSNLTDARYFAAAGVDYLGFSCDLNTEYYCAPSKIKEITEWVEGPEFVMEFEGWQNVEDILQLAQSGLGQAFHFGVFARYNRFFSMPVFQDCFVENINESDFSNVDFPVICTDRTMSQLAAWEIENIRKLGIEKRVFLDMPFSPDEWSQLIEEMPIYGIILRGGQEEKTGFKSFDTLDALFDVLT